jgi:hypothetical protein
MGYEAVPGANVYCHWAIFPAGLPAHSRGSEKDMIVQLAAVLDEDGDKNEFVTLVAEPDFILETSAGNRQLFYLFDRALPVAEGPPVAMSARKSQVKSTVLPAAAADAASSAGPSRPSPIRRRPDARGGNGWLAKPDAKHQPISGMMPTHM